MAQRRLVSTVALYEDKIRALEREVKDRRRIRDKAGVNSALNLIRCLQQRQIVLRRLADSILYVLVSGKHWVLRRMTIHGQIPRIDPQTLSRTCEVATELNRENRMKFSLISDLTTCVHIGDLVEISFEHGHAHEWRIVELKEGAVNEKLKGKMDELGDSPSDMEVEASAATLDHNSASQFKRMLRQKQRENQFNQIVETDVGTDPKTQLQMRLTDTIQVEDYFEAIRRCIDKLERQPMAAAKLPGGFSIAAARGDLLELRGAAPVAHTFYHLQNPSLECQLFLKDEEKLREEFRSMASLPPFHDLVQMNLTAQWSPPIFYWPIPDKVAMDLLAGRKRLFGQLDWKEFFEFARTSGIDLKWAKDSDLGEMRATADVLPGSPNARAVTARLRVSGPSGPIVQYMSGFFGRMFLEFMMPRQIIEMMHKDLERFAHRK